MFATRKQDENAINTQQQVAAAKPLNASVRGLAPKTPANKPAFRTPAPGNKNDENSKLDFGKTEGKEGKVDRNAFITPANNRTRAPLGNKTTNAKALQTPALQVPEEDKTKATSPRLRRSKIKVHEALETAHDVLNTAPEEREVEYMPPREVPLNDDPEDILPYPMNMDVLKGKNLTRGWYSEYIRKEDDDEDSELSDFEEKMRKAKKEEEKRLKPALTRTGRTVPLKAAPNTIRAQKAASALGGRPVPKPAIPSFAAPTAMAEARLVGSTISAGRKPASAAGNRRFTAAKAASNSTIGYSKGRSVAASTRPPLSSIHTRAPQSKKEEPKMSTLNSLLKLGAMDHEDDDDDDDDDVDTGFSAPRAALDALLGDDDEEVFQLDHVENI